MLSKFKRINILLFILLLFSLSIPKNIMALNIEKNTKNFLPIENYNDLFYAIKNKETYEIKDKKIKQVYIVAENIISKVIKKNMSDIEKEKALHDYVVNNSKYDYDNYINDTIPKDSYSPYGILVIGTGVSEGYAKTMNLLLTMVGIDTAIVSGKEYEENHTWNIVKLDGEYYHLDAASDDPVTYYNRIRKHKLEYDYFNLSDEQIAKDHSWNSDIRCNGIKYNYYYYNYCKKNKIKLDNYKIIHGKITIPEQSLKVVKNAGTILNIYAQSIDYKTKDNNNYYDINDYAEIGVTGFKIQKTIKIPYGDKTIDYSLVIPNDGKKYKVYYKAKYYTENFLPQGYYSKNGIINEEDENTFMNLKKDNKINLNIQEGRKLTVKLSLPQGDTAPENGLRFSIYVYYRNSHPSLGYMASNILIPAEKNSTEFEITGLRTKDEFTLEYYLRSNCNYYYKHRYFINEDSRIFISEDTDYADFKVHY